MGFEDEYHEAVHIHIHPEHVRGLPLLEHAAEIVLVQAVRDELGGGKGVGGKGGQLSGVENLCIALLRDEIARLFNEERRAGFAFLEKILQGSVNLLEVLFDEIWKRRHVATQL